MRNRRDRRGPNKRVYHVTNRTLHGLPFVARKYMNMMLLGILARGQSLYPVQIVALTFMANHPHLILAGRAHLISLFMNYLDGEVAQAIKRVFPDLYQGNVWKDRYREQVLATPEDVIDKIAYTYANAARAGLVNTVDDYQGVSTWRMFTTGSHRVEHPWIRRAKLSSLPSKFSQEDEKQLIKEWKKTARLKHPLILSPYVWRKCFAESECWTKEEIYRKVMSRVAEKEEAARAERTDKEPLVLPAHFNDPRSDYRPKKKTRTPFIQCHLPDLRKRYIENYQIFCSQLQSVARLLRRGLLKVREHLPSIPTGGYLPGGMLSSVLIYSLLPSG